jgi:hypothetical protein
MRFILTPVKALFLLPVLLHLFTCAATAAHIFLVTESIGGPQIERIEIDDGEVKSLDGDEVLTVVLPLGIGQSGDLVKRDMRGGSLTISSVGGEILVVKRNPDGKEIEYPAVKIADLPAYNIRVNITGGDGFKRAFYISLYEEAEVDDGPVIDMFAGMIPLEDGDYSITLEISRSQQQVVVSGEAVILYENGFLITEGSLADGRSGYFIIDFGASGTVVEKGFLPAYVEIEEVKGLEYSDEGFREVRSVMSGAGGEVTGFLGVAGAGNMKFGDVVFPDVTVKVIETMPEFGARKIIGILGLDLLKLCDRIAFEYPRGGPGIMMMGGRHTTAGTDAPAAEVPFYLVAKHVFLDGEINEVPVSLLFDTGARNSIISAAIADVADLSDSEDGERGEVRGLDNNPVETRLVIADRLRLGEWLRSDVPMLAADLSVFERIGLRNGGGIIGNDFLDDYSLVEVDFEDGIVSLWR